MDQHHQAPCESICTLINHLPEWPDECNRLGIKIKSKDALRAIEVYCGVTAESQTQQRPKFTPETFLNALAEFFIASDQVCFNFNFV